MTPLTEIRQRAKNLVDQLPGESLAEAVEFLEALCREAGQRSLVATSKPEEAALLQIIQRRLSEDDQTRLAYLRYSKREWRHHRGGASGSASLCRSGGASRCRTS